MGGQQDSVTKFVGVIGALASWLQDAAQEGCADSGDVGGGKLKPRLNDQQLKELLTQGQAAQAKVRFQQPVWCTSRVHALVACACWRSCACNISGRSCKPRPAVCTPQVLRFKGTERLFGGWADPEAAQRFKQRLDQYAAIWCCVDAHPGHVWYDFSWDAGAHTDRHGRSIGEQWRPLTGP